MRRSVFSQTWSNALPIVVPNAKGTLVGKDGATTVSRDSDLPDINSSKVTERIEATAFELLEQHPDGLRWTDLRKKIEESDPGFHPKTVNGCVWKLVERYPDRIHKPAKGLFRLLKHESDTSS